MSPLSLSPLKKSIYKHFVTRRSHYSRPFEIFESMAEIFYPIKGIRCKNWRRPSEKCALASQESINTSIAEKGGCIVWNNNLFTDSPMDIADCIVNICSCLREKSSSINDFICGLIPRDESRSVNRVLIKHVSRILK